MTQTIKSPLVLGLVITLDSKEIYPNDPGQGTPAMVALMSANGKCELDNGTFYCAVETGELSYNQTQLSDEQNAWLELQREAVDKFIRDSLSICPA